MARVVCTACGLELAAAALREEIEAARDAACEPPCAGQRAAAGRTGAPEEGP